MDAFFFQQPSSSPSFAGHSWNKFIVNWLFITSHLTLAESCFRQHSTFTSLHTDPQSHRSGNEQAGSLTVGIQTQIHDAHIHLQASSSTFRLNVAANLVSLELDYVVNNAKLMKNMAPKGV